jgi:uracil-DNA glycosylase family 4
MVRPPDCCKCQGLCASRTRIVFPDLPEWGRSSRLLVIGEAPGADEDRQGKGFVGRSGRTLHRLLEEQGLFRGVHYGCANIVRCRPPGNRRPTAEEVFNCLPFLAQILRKARPEAVLLVGASATAVFCGDGSLSDRMGDLERSGYLADKRLCHVALSEVLEGRDAPGVFAMPHTSPLAWNRNAPDGRKWSTWGKEVVVSMASALRKNGGGFGAAR